MITIGFIFRTIISIQVNVIFFDFPNKLCKRLIVFIKRTDESW